ncbi:hypothetical protein, partial [Xanthomonas oryzae]
QFRSRLAARGSCRDARCQGLSQRFLMIRLHPLLIAQSLALPAVSLRAHAIERPADRGDVDWDAPPNGIVVGSTEGDRFTCAPCTASVSQTVSW